MKQIIIFNEYTVVTVIFSKRNREKQYFSNKLKSNNNVEIKIIDQID